MKNLYKQGKISLIKQGMVFLTLLTLVACQNSSSQKETPVASPSPDLDSRLTLTNATLEQSNIKGQLLWKIQVEEANYSADKETANLTKIKGNILQDGKIVLKISANKGEIQQNGQNVKLKENIIAIDPRNQAVLRSEEVEWQPETGILMIQQPLKGYDPHLEVIANRAQYSPREQQLNVSGNIVATSRDPKLQLKTEQLLWKIPQKQVIADKPVNMIRFDGKTITDKVKAEQAIVDLIPRLVTIQKQIEFNSINPPLQMGANVLRWQYKDRIVSSDQPIKIVYVPEKVTLTGNKGVANLNAQVIHLSDGVRGDSPQDGGKLYTDNLVYDLGNKGISAVGNIIYEKAKPPFNLTGTQAYGLIQDQTIKNLVITGDPKERVVTEIFPE